jgi:phage tail-like protein
MARSSTQDPLEKFRFRITVIAISPTLSGAIETLANALPSGTEAEKYAKQVRVLARAGFSEISLPRQTVTEISYRENTDAYRFIKVPGLVRYEPVILKRGVTANRDLYDWLRQVNDESALLVVAGELANNIKKGPKQSENFRKDVIIEVLDREGSPIKGWYLFNAWPTSYKPGDDLNAKTDEKLIEETTLTYEVFMELEGGLKGFAKEIAKGAVEAVIDAYADKIPWGR